LRTRSSLLRVVSRRELMLASDCPRECAGTSATIASAASVSAAATAAGRLFGAAPAIVLFPALTGLAVGLALKESRYAGPPAISPRLRLSGAHHFKGWFPRSPAFRGGETQRF